MIDDAEQGGAAIMACKSLRGVPMIANISRILLLPLLLAASLLAAAAGDTFPFGSTLMLDAAPMRGSKRIPMIEIAEDGAASIDLWCASARAQAVITDHAISIAAGDLESAQCEPDRQSRDEELLAALAQVTNWRRNGDLVEFLGATPLRFRLMTN